MPEKLTHCRFRGKRSNHGPANREYIFRSYFTSPFFIEIEFSVWTITRCWTNKRSRFFRTRGLLRDMQAL